MRDHSKTRRNFLKIAGTLGAGSLLTAVAPSANATPRGPVKSHGGTSVPTRPFGNTGINVSILSLGGILKPSDLLVFRQAFKMGVTYWDTADSYKWGKNEKAIGKYFDKFPEDREQVFLVTKAATSNPKELTEKLDQSLARMRTEYVDMYFIHYVKDATKELTAEVQAWAEKAKSSGKIRLFGFSTHKNMETTMLTAAKLGWIDGIMMSYNYRLMNTEKMKRAVDACVQAGIGLTAMKTQAAFSANFYSTIGSETDEALKMTAAFMDKGYTAEQAKLKAVWENPAIASICSAIPNMTILQANVAAAVDKQKLSRGDHQRMGRYAAKTAAGYCSGCGDICESAIDGAVPICDIMRHAMYHYSYGDERLAREYMQGLSAQVKAGLSAVDYSRAEQVCPQGVQIGRILKKVQRDLS